MAAVLFYHITRNPIEVTLATLLGKSLEAGWRVAVRTGSADQSAHFDTALWKGAEGSFLPHDIAGGDHDADQPILISDRPTGANDPKCLLTLGGAAFDPAEAEGVERLCVLFDGNDPAAMNTARQQWVAVKEAGVKAQYWSEDSGRWEMQSET